MRYNIAGKPPDKPSILIVPSMSYVAVRGKGLIPEAVRELVRHGFEDLKLDKIWCGYFDGNEKSKRVQEKCGFVWHHTRKDVCCELMGDIRTEQITCLTRSDWLSQSKA